LEQFATLANTLEGANEQERRQMLVGFVFDSAQIRPDPHLYTTAICHGTATSGRVLTPDVQSVYKQLCF
jgi:hypothetical protein